MSVRPEQPEPYLRGCVFPYVGDVPYPRADPAGADHLPGDVWDAARLPVGIRLEMIGDARTVRVWYETSRASFGYRGESAGCSFVAYRGGQKVGEQEATMGQGMAELAVAGRPDLPLIVYLPEGMCPLITGVAGVDKAMEPAPRQPRWLAYGDAVTQGWLASAPAMAWPAVAGRKLGLDVCNLGYAGTAHGEVISAATLADTPAEVISIAFGMNSWSRVPQTASLIAEEVRCFLAIVRDGHPSTPIVVVSPTTRPAAEDKPNRVGATLAELRSAMEEAVLQRIDGGDTALFLVEGLNVLDPEHLEDGMYPGDEGHRRLAAAVSKVLAPLMAEIQHAAAERRQLEQPEVPWDSGVTAAGAFGPGVDEPGGVAEANAADADVPEPVAEADAADEADAAAPEPVTDADAADAATPEPVAEADAADAATPEPVAEADAADAADADVPEPVAEADAAAPEPVAEADAAAPEPVAAADADVPEPVADADAAAPEPVANVGATTPEPVADAATPGAAAGVAAPGRVADGVADDAVAPNAAAISATTPPRSPARPLARPTREPSPADILVADMVATALAIATNGGFDSDYEPDDTVSSEEAS